MNIVCGPAILTNETFAVAAVQSACVRACEGERCRGRQCQVTPFILAGVIISHVFMFWCSCAGGRLGEKRLNVLAHLHGAGLSVRQRCAV